MPGPYLIARDNFYIPNRVHDNIFLTLSEVDIHPFRLNTFVNVAKLVPQILAFTFNLNLRKILPFLF